MQLENQDFVDQQIAEGRFVSVDQVVDEALRRWREEELTAGLDDLRQKIDAGVRDLDAGRSAPLDMQAIKDRVRAERESA